MNFLSGINTNTKDGFAEALLICLRNLKNKNGELVACRLSFDPLEEIEMAKHIADAMLKARGE